MTRHEETGANGNRLSPVAVQPREGAEPWSGTGSMRGSSPTVKTDLPAYAPLDLCPAKRLYRRRPFGLPSALA